MYTRSAIFTLLALVITATAAPNPLPIDSGTARVIAVNDNLACSTGSCNTTIAETNGTSVVPGSYTNGAWKRPDAWSPLTFLAAGGLALSTGML